MKQKVDNTATECCKTQHDEKGDVDIAVSIFATNYVESLYLRNAMIQINQENGINRNVEMI